jgi:hypothetical protein
MGFYPAFLCASASLRELVLVAAEGRSKKAGVEESPDLAGFPSARE